MRSALAGPHPQTCAPPLLASRPAPCLPDDAITPVGRHIDTRARRPNAGTTATLLSKPGPFAHACGRKPGICARDAARSVKASIHTRAGLSLPPATRGNGSLWSWRRRLRTMSQSGRVAQERHGSVWTQGLHMRCVYTSAVSIGRQQKGLQTAAKQPDNYLSSF
jgi:hypothetical protein